MDVESLKESVINHLSHSKKLYLKRFDLRFTRVANRSIAQK